MIDKNDETAFPVPIGQTGEDRCGMSLRDWFAGMAMESLLEPDDVQYMDGTPNRRAKVARIAYKMADEMMEARKEAKQ